MGRKPNQLILEFFDRGPKLEDASNRYQHTCRACGDHFPKGRIDNLITHLTKICQGISTEDRQRAVLRFKEDGVTQQGSKSIPHRGTAIQLPVGEGRKLTGLEALAEASRQIEFPGNGGEYNREEDSTIDPSLRGPEMYGRLFDGQIREQSGLGNQHNSICEKTLTDSSLQHKVSRLDQISSPSLYSITLIRRRQLRSCIHHPFLRALHTKLRPPFQRSLHLLVAWKL